MDFGMFTDFHVRKGMTQAEAFEESFSQLLAAEEKGLDSVWLAEHHFTPDRSVLASPLIIATAIAARTSRIRVGLAVQVLPLTNPLRIAEEAATVDHISRGRFDFGIGRSGLTKYYAGYNIPYSESRGRFFEALDVIMKAWTQEEFSHQGEYYSYGRVNVVPKPYQDPHPPTRIALASADTFPMVGKLGYLIFISGATAVPQMQERLELYRKARKEAGHSEPESITLRIPAYVAETAKQARDEPEASTLYGLQYAARELSGSAATPEAAERLRQMGDVPYEEILQRRVMYGTPEAVTERLREYQEELGITGVVLEMNYGGQLPNERLINSVRLLADKVMPNFN